MDSQCDLFTETVPIMVKHVTFKAVLSNGSRRKARAP